MSNSRRRARSRPRRWLERFLLAAGLVGLSVWMWSIASQSIYQDWGNWVFDRQMKGQSATVSEYLAEKKTKMGRDFRAFWKKSTGAEGGDASLPPAPVVPSPAPDAAPPSTAPPSFEENAVVGRLSIPRLRLNAVVREGVGEGTLRVALGHIPGTAFPGNAGNVGLAGHRDTIFRPLRDIHKQDLIELETTRGTYTYRVESTAIVKPDDVSVLKALDRPELTLVTCYPFYYVGSAPDRFIVKAVQVSNGPADTSPPAVTQKSAPESNLKAEADTAPDPTPDPTPAVNPAPRPHRESRRADRTSRRADRDARSTSSRGMRKVAFEIRKGSSRQLAPGVSLGLNETDPSAREIDGWMWLMPERRTIWLRAKGTHAPVVFYSRADGLKRELRITRVASNSVAGYLLVPDRRPYSR